MRTIASFSSTDTTYGPVRNKDVPWQIDRNPGGLLASCPADKNIWSVLVFPRSMFSSSIWDGYQSHHKLMLLPLEVLHAPEGVGRKHERNGSDGENVKHRSSDHVPLASKDEHESLRTMHDTNNDERDDRSSASLPSLLTETIK
jgi:hypothetical protein